MSSITVDKETDVSRKAVFDELHEIARHVDEAVHVILAGAEKIETILQGQSIPGREKLDREIITIMEACHIHDITVQRIKKIRGLLGDDTVSANYRPGSPERLEAGPQLRGEGINQDEIDDLLNGA